MARKKKLKKDNRKIIRLIIIISIIVVVSFVFLMTFLVKHQKFFNVISEQKEIAKYKKDNPYTIVGWLRVQGTNIDYPVLFYDDAPISDVTQNFGWTFKDTNKLQDRTVIEGHNIMNMSSNPSIADKNSKRFEQLLSFYDPDFVKNNKYIEYSTGDSNYMFKIFAVGFPEIESYYMQSDFEGNEKEEYINNAIDDSLYKFDVDVDTEDKIISLYTCTKFFGYDKAVSFRIDGRLVRKNEKIENYKFSKTVNYDEAKKYSKSVTKSQEVNS